MAPAVAALERELAASSRGAPASPSAARFRSEVLPRASKALAAFRAGPPAGALLGERPEELQAAVWAGFRELQERLAAELRVPRLELAQVRPSSRDPAPPKE
jgi:hypothetical protein